MRSPFPFLALSLAALASCGSSPLPTPEPLPENRTADGRFRNTDVDELLYPRGRKGFSDVHFATYHPLPIATGGEEFWKNSTASSACWIGHSTFYLQLHVNSHGQSRTVGILTDPVFSDRASPVPFAGPKRATPPGRSLEELPQIDVVLISHSHYDHLDKKSIKAIHRKSPEATFLVPLGIGELLRGWGIPQDLIVERDWWQDTGTEGLTFTFVPAHHSSQRSPFKSSLNRTLWGGWVIEAGEKKIWFTGDTGMGNGDYFREIARRFAPLDLSLIPIGAYSPDVFRRSHINPEEAVALHLLTHSARSIGMHWGTFALTGESMEQPLRDLSEACRKSGATGFSTLRHGEITRILDVPAAARFAAAPVF